MIIGFVKFSVICLVIWIVNVLGVNFFKIICKKVIIINVMIKDKILVSGLFVWKVVKRGWSNWFSVGLLS